MRIPEGMEVTKEKRYLNLLNYLYLLQMETKERAHSKHRESVEEH